MSHICKVENANYEVVTGDLLSHMTKEERASLLNKLRSMKDRCYYPKNKNYPLYGAKGIGICDEWLNDKESFIKWAETQNYKLGLTIERHDNSMDYSPNNCCFVPMSMQPKNTSRNVFVDYHGETLIISDVARREGVSCEAIRKRIKRGKYRVVDNPNRLRVQPNTLLRYEGKKKLWE